MKQKLWAFGDDFMIKDEAGTDRFYVDGKAISDQVYRLVTEWHGSISAEHGIGQLKRDALASLGDPVALEMMRAIKQALDPRGDFEPRQGARLRAPARSRQVPHLAAFARHG